MVNQYRGRFAPSPTGPLHFGSLVAATAAYLDAKANHGKFLIRIEDLDPPREIPGSDKLILETLEAFGFEWDETIIYQSQRTSVYNEYLHKLDLKQLIYRCQCSRRFLRAQAQQGQYGIIYPNHCRSVKVDPNTRHAIRVKVTDKPISITDRLFGKIEQNLLQTMGDFIIRRSDHHFAYQFAVVIDDALQHITDVVRGSDLLDSTPRQVYLQHCFGFKTPHYLHLPIAIGANQQKLSKQTGAAAILANQATSALFQALVFLGQNPPHELKQSHLTDIWHWAIQHWQANLIPKQRQLALPTIT